MLLAIPMYIITKIIKPTLQLPLIEIAKLRPLNVDTYVHYVYVYYAKTEFIRHSHYNIEDQ